MNPDLRIGFDKPNQNRRWYEKSVRETDRPKVSPKYPKLTIKLPTWICLLHSPRSPPTILLQCHYHSLALLTMQFSYRWILSLLQSFEVVCLLEARSVNWLVDLGGYCYNLLIMDKVSSDCPYPGCFFCVMKEANPSKRRASVLKFFRELPCQDDDGQVLPISGLWNTTMAHPNDPEFIELGIFEWMSALIWKGLKNRRSVILTSLSLEHLRFLI